MQKVVGAFCSLCLVLFLGTSCSVLPPEVRVSTSAVSGRGEDEAKKLSKAETADLAAYSKRFNAEIGKSWYGFITSHQRFTDGVVTVHIKISEKGERTLLSLENKGRANQATIAAVRHAVAHAKTVTPSPSVAAIIRRGGLDVSLTFRHYTQSLPVEPPKVAPKDRNLKVTP